MAGSISTRILLSGGKEFANQFKTIASNVKEASSALKLLDKNMEQNGRTADSLRDRIAQLTRIYDLHESAINLVENRMREMAATGKLTEQQQAEFTNEINNHRIAQREVADQLYRTTQELDKFGTEADQAEKETKELGSAARDSGNALGSDFASDVAIATVALQEAVNIAKAVGRKIFEVGKEAVQYNANIETSQKTIEAFFRTSGQGYEEAQKNAESLIQTQKNLSKQIGVGTDTLIDANKMLIASGVNGNRSQQAVSALAKAIVATGGGNDELARMVQNLQQIQNVGKASATDMKQFGMAGVDVYSLLADSTGKTVGELKKMDITFDMIVDALDQATQEGGKFFEASQVGAETLNGKFNILQSLVKEGLGTSFEPVNEALRDRLIPAAIDFVEGVDWNAIGNALAWVVEETAQFLETVGEFKDWYVSVYGQPAVETIDAFNSTNAEVKDAFYENAGAIEVFTSDMAAGVEAVKGHGNHMVMEFDGMKEGVTTSVQETAGKVKNELVTLGWDMMAQGTTDAKSFAQGLKNGEAKPLQEAQSMMDQIKRKIDMRADAERYGLDFVSGFATGMHRNNGLVANAAATIASTVRKWLHFSRPDVGPLRDYEEWMPDMMQGFAKGIDDNVWRVRRAASNAAGAMAAATNYSTTNFNGGINLTVNAAPGMNENQIADVVMARMQEATRRKQAVWQ